MFTFHKTQFNLAPLAKPQVAPGATTQPARSTVTTPKGESYSAVAPKVPCVPQSSPIKPTSAEQSDVAERSRYDLLKQTAEKLMLGQKRDEMSGEVLQRKLVQAEQTISHHVATIGSAQEVNSKLHSMLEQAKKTAEAQEFELKALQALCVSVKETFGGYKQEYNKMVSDMEHLGAECRSRSKTVEQLEQMAATLQDNMAQLSEKHDMLLRQNEELKTACEDEQKKGDAARRYNEQLSAELCAVQKQYDEAQQEHKAAILLSEQKVASFCSEMDKWKVETLHWRASAESSSKAASEYTGLKNKEIEGFVAQLKEVCEENNILSGLFAAQKEEIVKLQALIAHDWQKDRICIGEMKEQIKALEQQHDELRAEKHFWQTQNNEHLSKLEGEERRRKELEAALEHAKNQALERERSLDENIRDLMGHKAQVEAQSLLLQEKTTSMQQQLKQEQEERKDQEERWKCQHERLAEECQALHIAVEKQRQENKEALSKLAKGDKALLKQKRKLTALEEDHKMQSLDLQALQHKEKADVKAMEALKYQLSLQQQNETKLEALLGDMKAALDAKDIDWKRRENEWQVKTHALNEFIRAQKMELEREKENSREKEARKDRERQASQPSAKEMAVTEKEKEREESGVNPDDFEDPVNVRTPKGKKKPKRTPSCSQPTRRNKPRAKRPAASKGKKAKASQDLFDDVFAFHGSE